MNRPIDAATAEKGRVRRVHDGIDVFVHDVPMDEFQDRLIEAPPAHTDPLARLARHAYRRYTLGKGVPAESGGVACGTRWLKILRPWFS